MDSADHLTPGTPHTKRRKTHDDSSQRSSSPGTSPNARKHSEPRSREPRDPSQSRYDVTRSPSAAGSNKHYSSRSRSRRRSRSISSSGSSTRSESPPLSRTRSRRRSGSPTSSDRTRTESYSPRPRQPSPTREPSKPNYRPRLVLHGHTGPVSQVRISPNGKFIASASADGTLKLWDAATGAHMDTLVGHMAGVSCVAWTPDSNTLASGSDDKAIRLWDRVTGRPKTTTRKSIAGQEMAALRGHHNYIHCLAFSPKGNILASGSYDEAVFLWDVRAGRLMRSLPAHSDPVSGIDFCRDGTLVVSCSTDGLIRVWDTSTGQCLRTLVHEDNPAVTNVCFSPNGRFVLAFNLDNCIRLWDYVAGTVKKTYQGHRNEKFAIGGCFGVLDGEPFIASASEDGDVILWNVKNKEILQRISTGHKGVCFWVDVNGEILASAGQDHTIRVYKHVREGGVTNGSMRSEVEMTSKLKGELPIRQEDIKLEDA
ncbi:will die slowly [Metarhizium guizhouense ARSEF 977]|uniref:Mitochondrial division protein 1 n=1 Tax=Metarhizium guizhouense (strain ARSEF 977) TaxID=1276136 RepID=A0A0B4I9B8_METGA|nr:will die slowly [Metarhizium guizhouense ARSEF 977]